MMAREFTHNLREEPPMPAAIKEAFVQCARCERTFFLPFPVRDTDQFHAAAEAGPMVRCTSCGHEFRCSASNMSYTEDCDSAGIVGRRD